MDYDRVLYERHNRATPRNMQEAADADLVVLERQDGSWEIWKDRYDTGGTPMLYPSRAQAPPTIQEAVAQVEVLR